LIMFHFGLGSSIFSTAKTRTTSMQASALFQASPVEQA
jgi:hypothetical protein